MRVQLLQRRRRVRVGRLDQRMYAAAQVIVRRLAIGAGVFIVQTRKELDSSARLALRCRPVGFLGRHTVIAAGHGRFRESDVLRQVFEAVVRARMDAGLVNGEGFAVDASVMEAAGRLTENVEWWGSRDRVGTTTDRPSAARPPLARGSLLRREAGSLHRRRPQLRIRILEPAELRGRGAGRLQTDGQQALLDVR
jgi:hypothetical protein